MKRSWQVKIVGHSPFTMIIMEFDDDPRKICEAIFGERLEWVE